jgi:hypothetical protein
MGQQLDGDIAKAQDMLKRGRKCRRLRPSQNQSIG